MSLEQDIKALERAFEALLEHVHDAKSHWVYYCAAIYLHEWAAEFTWCASTAKCKNGLCRSGYTPGKRKHTVKLCPVCKGKGRMKKGAK